MSKGDGNEAGDARKRRRRWREETRWERARKRRERRTDVAKDRTRSSNHICILGHTQYGGCVIVHCL